MTEIHPEFVEILASSRVTDADLTGARLGPRFGRLDLLSQLAVLAVDRLGVKFEDERPERIGVCLAACDGSLSTDVDYWRGRDDAGGPSPTLFAYTLPSSAIGEIAIRYRLTGPNLCIIGDETQVLPEASDMIVRGEIDGCICASCHVLSSIAAGVLQTSPAATASAFYLIRRARMPAGKSP